MFQITKTATARAVRVDTSTIQIFLDEAQREHRGREPEGCDGNSEREDQRQTDKSFESDNR